MLRDFSRKFWEISMVKISNVKKSKTILELICDTWTQLSVNDRIILIIISVLYLIHKY